MKNKHQTDSTWTLFLDRDGVINRKRENDYVKRWEEFEFLDGVLDSLKKLTTQFERLIIVTNQQGIGKGAFSENDLQKVHTRMLQEINSVGGRIDKIYFCSALAADNADCRKPNIGMALQAKNDFPEINFKKSIIVGDSISDMEFGNKLGMLKIFISKDKNLIKKNIEVIDFNYSGLAEFAENV